MKKFKVFHPFLFAVYPVLYLYSYNVHQVSFSNIIFPSIILLAGTLILYLAFSVFFRNNEKAAILVSLFISMFMVYGRVFNRVWWWHIGSVNIGKPRYLFLAGGLVFLAITLLVKRMRKEPVQITRYLNIVSIILISFSIVNISIYKFKNQKKIKIEYAQDLNLHNVQKIKDISGHPNIFYIILDGYARENVLNRIYNFDNSEFLDYLDQKGFFVAEQSCSNYCQTSLSLTSSLNLMYLNKITDQLGVNNFSRIPLRKMIRQNSLFSFLSQHGYNIVSFSSGYSFTKLQNVDLYMVDHFVSDEFFIEIMNTTPVPHILNEIKSANEFGWHRDRINYIFDEIYKIPRDNEPYFVFAHIISPHPPFIFKANGEDRNQNRAFSFKDGSHFFGLKGATQKEYINNYVRQLQYINSKVIATIDSLLSRSPENPPIIVLQSDHGPGSHLNWKSKEKSDVEERLAILNAYFMPGYGDSLLYDTITPVNSFRVILNHYFDTNLKLLADKSYYSTWNRPYDFKIADSTDLGYTEDTTLTPGSH